MAPESPVPYTPDNAPEINSLQEGINQLQGMVTMRQMPRYQSHKKVWALKIKEVQDPTQPGSESDGSRIIVPEEEGYAPFRVDRDYVFKHRPEAGGYFVQYEDGYKSFSPAKAFEDGYTRL